MTLSKRDKNMLLALAGIIIFLLVYFLAYNPLIEENDKLDETLEERNVVLMEYENYYNNLDTYQVGISSSKEAVAANLAHLPAGVKEEDFLVYLINMANTYGVDMNSVSYDADSLVSQFDCYIGDGLTTVSGHRVGTVSSMKLSYGQLKKVIDHIYATNDTTFIDSVSVTYNSETALLDGIFNISKYYAEYETAEYVPAVVPTVPLTTPNPFGTVSTPFD